MLDLLNNETSIDKALSLAGTLIKLNPPSDEYAQARTRTLELLASLTDVPSWYRLKTLTDLEMDASELAMARASMLELLSNEEDDYGLISFVGTFAQMSPTRDEVERLRQELLGRLTYATSEMDAALRGQFSRGPNLTDTKLRTNKYLPSVSRLDRERRLIRQVTESPQESQAAEPDRDHLKQKRERLLQLLSSWIGTQAAFEAAGALENLNPEPSELELARCLLARRASHKLRYIAEAIVKITAAEERDQAKQMLLGVLAHVTDAESGAELARKLVGLDPSQHELVQARKALLNVISQAVGAEHMLKLVRELVGLNPGHDEAAEARHSLLLMLENPANTEHAYELA